MLKAVIDIGSNSIKMRIADVKNGHIRVLQDETEVVRLGRGMNESGILESESMKLSCKTVAKMSRKAEKAGAKIFMVGTMALRLAQNAKEFTNMVKSKTGHEVNVFTGEEEAKYSWIGAIDGFDTADGAIMFDSGGGSTEFVSGSEIPNKIASVPVGAVNISEKFFNEHDKPVKMSKVEEAYDYTKELLIKNDIENFKRDKSRLIGVGGGVVTMSSVKNACENFMPYKLHGSVLTQSDIRRQIKMYSSLTLKERENIIGLPASRADVILGSACIVLAILEILERKSFIVSINGLRHGILLSENLLK